MDVVNAEQAKIAEEAGILAVNSIRSSAPSDIRAAGRCTYVETLSCRRSNECCFYSVMAKSTYWSYRWKQEILEAMGVTILMNQKC